MTDTIGEAAGVIWGYLDRNGNISTAALVKGTKLKQREADRAIGWLAREGKIRIEKTKKGELISLV